MYAATRLGFRCHLCSCLCIHCLFLHRRHALVSLMVPGSNVALEDFGMLGTGGCGCDINSSDLGSDITVDKLTTCECL